MTAIILEENSRRRSDVSVLSSPLSPLSLSLSPAGISAVCAGLCWPESSLVRCQTQSEDRRQALLHCFQILMPCRTVPTHRAQTHQLKIQYNTDVQDTCSKSNQSRYLYDSFPKITMIYFY